MLENSKGGREFVIVLCFLWKDPEFQHRHLFVYDAHYVNVLRSMLDRHLTLPHELVCCADDPEGIDPDVRIVPLPKEAWDLGTYNRKIYVFHPDAKELFGSRILMLDLDVVLVGNIDEFASRTEPFVGWAGHPNGKNRFNTSFVLMDGGAFPEVWEDFTPDSLDFLKAEGYDGFEQDWVSVKIGQRGVAIPRGGAGIDSFGSIRSRPLPESTRMVFFNGRSSPKMSQCRKDAPWIEDHWKD